MNWQGWVFMLSAWTFFTVLLVYCFYRILSRDFRQGRDSD
ncbi:MAG: hypothetical protein KatS3mg023_2218 [Armatimonadota bacterium]|jgi:hypothetical protein|nr:MAG: hypothetical protein KatS3mg023_2218 [Armatimonadota bacterium]